MIKPCLLLSTLVLCAPGSASAASGAFDVSYQLIVDSNTPQPTHPGLTFSGIGGAEFVNTNDSVLFTNFSLSGDFPSVNGVYQWDKNDNSVNTIVDARTAPFGTSPDRYVFLNNYVNQGEIVFRARFSSGVQGIYRASATQSAVRLFGAGDGLPDGRGVASDVLFPRVQGNDVLFTARGSDEIGRVYRTDLSGSGITTLLDENTPGVEGAASFALGDFKDGYLAFRTLNQPLAGIPTGVFTSDLNGNVNPIARLGDPLPGAPGQTIGSFAGDTLHPSISGGKIVYTANGSGGTDGIYIAPVTGGASEVVIDDTTELPGDPDGNTAGFAFASISGDNISFLGMISGGGFATGLWVSMGGELVDIVHFNDQFDGRTVSRIFSSPFSMYDNTVAFQIVFTDNTRGLYLATIIPTPGSAAILALGGLWAGRRRRGSLDA